MNETEGGRIERVPALSRRAFLRGAAGVGLAGAGAVLLGGCGSDDGKGSPTRTPEVVDPPPETTTIRLAKSAAPCKAPLYLAEQFLPAEGFTNVQYIDETFWDTQQQLAAGEVDIHLVFPDDLIAGADGGSPLVVLAGVHNSCFELFGNDRVQLLRDLKGKRIWVLGAEGSASLTDLTRPTGLTALSRRCWHTSASVEARLNTLS